MDCCNQEVTELLGHNDCGCEDKHIEHHCNKLFDIASPIEGQSLEYSEEMNAFVNKFREYDFEVGSGVNTLGENCPAITPNTPYTWIKLLLNDGTQIYVPAWK